MTVSYRRLIPEASRGIRRRQVVRSAAPMPIAAMGFYRDQDHRRALQSLLSGKLPRADRHHLGLGHRLDAVLPDGRAAARRVDEGPSGGAPGGVALRDRQTG